MMEEILEFSYRPKPNKKKVFPLLFTLMALSGVLFILSSTLQRYRGVIGLAALIGISVCMYLYLKYLSSELIYSVMVDSNNEAVFLVNKVIGKRSSLMFSAYLHDVVCIQKFAKNGENKYTYDKKFRKFNFTVTYGASEFYSVRVKSRECSLDVFLECTPEVAARLDSYARIAKSALSEEE